MAFYHVAKFNFRHPGLTSRDLPTSLAQPETAFYGDPRSGTCKEIPAKFNLCIPAHEPVISQPGVTEAVPECGLFNKEEVHAEIPAMV